MVKRGTKSRAPQAPVEGRFRDRIREFVRLRVGDLEEHPLNYRLHPGQQMAAVSGLLTEASWKAAVQLRPGRF